MGVSEETGGQGDGILACIQRGTSARGFTAGPWKRRPLVDRPIHRSRQGRRHRRRLNRTSLVFPSCPNFVSPGATLLASFRCRLPLNPPGAFSFINSSSHWRTFPFLSSFRFLCRTTSSRSRSHAVPNSARDSIRQNYQFYRRATGNFYRRDGLVK